MPVVIVVGAQWGDEGKGKIIDFLAEKANLVARYQGGPNAGHTVYIGKEKYVLHLIPSGILHKGVQCVIGSGVVVDPMVLLSEITTLRSRGIEVDDNLIISANAHIIMPYHLIMDKATENIKKNKKIGTTGKGIGPAYEDKIARYGIRAGDILQPKIFKEKLHENLFSANFLLESYFHLPALSTRQIYSDYLNYGRLLERYIGDTEMVVNQAIKKNLNLLFEGAQGTFLDVDHGTYPFVTSSNTIAGGACTGLGVGPTKINKVLGVSKAYTTRVGMGPFPTELKDEFGDYLRSKGKEFGATTGRPRRCGWLDLVMLRYAVQVNGLTGLAFTKIDILDGLDKIKICMAYEYQGKNYTQFPRNMDILTRCQPVYEEVDGWKEATSGVKTYESLPENARKYLKKIEDEIGINVQLISTGEERDSSVILENQFGLK